MAKQDTFTAEEWTLLRLTPSLVAGGMAAADPSGIFSSLKESFAGAKGMAEAFKTNSGLELFSALAADRSIPGMPDPKAMLGEGSARAADAQPQDRRARTGQVGCRAGGRQGLACGGRGLQADAASAWPSRPQNASKEGGFLGFGGVRVSDKEQAFISEVKAAVAPALPNQ